MDQERAAQGAAENHQNAGNRDAETAGQPEMSRTKSEATSTTPGDANT